MRPAIYRPPKRSDQFTAHILQEFLRRLQRHPRYPVVAHNDRLGAEEWWLTDLAHVLDMPPVTLYHWLRRGWLQARREDQSPHRWIIRADTAEVARLRALHHRSLGEEARQRWVAAAARVPLATPPATSGTEVAYHNDC
jgi:hypothetical protein